MSKFYEDIFYAESEAYDGDSSTLDVRKAKFDGEYANDHLLLLITQSFAETYHTQKIYATMHLPLEDVKALKEELENWIKEREKAND